MNTIRVSTVTLASVLVISIVATAGAQTPTPTPRAGLAGTAAKAAAKCEQSITKAATVFAAKRHASLKKCVDTVFLCVQTKAGDPKCLPKAQATCNKELAKIAAAQGKLVAGITGKCGPGDVTTSDLLDEIGLGFGSAAFVAHCTEVGVTVADVADVAECITKRHTCSVEEMLAVHAPLAEYLLGLVGLPLYSAFCPVVPVPTPTPTPEPTGATPTATETPAVTPTATSEGPTATATETPEATPTATPEEPTATATETPEATPTATPEEPTATATETPEATPTATPEEPTATATETPEATPTATPEEPTATATETPEATPTATAEEPTATATETPEPTPTP